MMDAAGRKGKRDPGPRWDFHGRNGERDKWNGLQVDGEPYLFDCKKHAADAGGSRKRGSETGHGPENNGDGIARIKVDAKGLEYISSAGLRVLMIAVKKLGQGSVAVLNASEAVKEIFEATGFDQMIAIE